MSKLTPEKFTNALSFWTIRKVESRHATKIMTGRIYQSGAAVREENGWEGSVYNVGAD